MGRNEGLVMLGVALVICLCLGSLFATARQVEGIVFVDENGNGVLDAGESGISGAAVSDGITVVRTDAAGAYSLPLDESARFVFLSTPSGMEASGGWYTAAGSSSSYDFPLVRVDREGPLVFAQISDIHYAPTPEEFKLGLRDRRMQILPDPILDSICEEIDAMSPDFVIVAGDIAADSKYPEPDVVDAWIGAMADRFDADIDVPVYSAVGNHDIIRDETIGTSIYESHLGPTYYSFNVKDTHCVVLNTHRLSGASLVYSIDAAELAWLEQDLGTVAARTPILVFCHEPTFDWADTPENQALFDLLAETGITALLNGHWHTNVVLREQPFYEMTSGATCGAWWEGPGPDGTGFGYRVFCFARGALDSIWRTAGQSTVEFASPSRAVLTWADRLLAKVWGEMETAAFSWDDGESTAMDVYWNGLWSSVSANLNVSTLIDGYHDFTLTFSAPGGEPISQTRSFYVANPDVPLAEIFDHPGTFQGRMVAAPALTVRAIMGSDISAFDDTRTIIISAFPYAVARNDVVGVVGMYHPTSTAPIKIYDDAFYTVFDDED